MYFYGKGIPQDYAEALKWYRKAAAQGHARSHALIAYMYSQGLGVEINESRAVSYFVQATRLGDAEAPRSLGYLYASGRGVPKDVVMAHALFGLAKSRGNKAADGEFRATRELLSDPELLGANIFK